MAKENLVNKYRLHPIGGYANDVAITEAIEAQRKRWGSLSETERAIADRQYLEMYPRTSNQDGR